MIRHLSIFLLLAFVAVGCEDKVSTLGAPFFPDTVQLHTITRMDTGFMQMTNLVHPTVMANGLTYNLTFGSPIMIVGRVASANENLESWGLLRFVPFNADSIKMVTSVRLILTTEKYEYGDTTNNNFSLRLYTESNNKVTDSTASLSASDVSASAVGSLDTIVANDSGFVLAIPIDSSVKSSLTASSEAFVLRPSSTMTNARAFRTCESKSFGAPRLQYTLKVGDSTVIVYRSTLPRTSSTTNGTLDMFVVQDQSVAPPNEFTIRGGTGRRERITLNLARPGDTANFSQFSTINSAILYLKLDPDNSRHSSLSFDKTLSVAQITGLSDTSIFDDGVGYADTIVDPTGMTYRFQVRSLVENWLRNPAANFGFELRAGLQSVGFGGVTIATEGNTLNRWTFYGSDVPDSTKRPKLVISYSQLR